MIADVEMLRSFPASGAPLAGRQIEVEFLAYGPSVTALSAARRRFLTLSPAKFASFPCG
jgi:hypothetical protein